MLNLRNRHLKRIGVTFGLWLWFGAVVRADEHVVPTEELNRQAVAASASRQAHRVELEKFLSSKPAREALRRANLSEAQVAEAVSVLTDEELANLAARAQAAQSDFAAGSLTNQQLTYIVIALGTAVLILIILAA
jgi:hypothetical protein